MTNQPQLVDLPDPMPVLDEHLLKDEDGHPIVYLNHRYLQRIADNNNRRIQETGDASPIVIGHTQDGQPEKDGPEIVGYGTRFFVSPGQRVGHKIVPAKTGKKYLFTRLKVYDNHLDTLRKYPRRSVELWTSRWEVDPISLLGATTPDRDLGLYRLSEKGPSVKVMTPSEEDDDPMNDLMNEDGPAGDESNEPLTMAAFEQSTYGRFLQELMEQLANGGGEQEPGLEEGGGEEAPVQEEEGMGGQEEEFSPEEEEEEPIRHSAGYPGGTNTFTPRKMKRETQMKQTSEHQLRVRLARAEAALAAQGDETQAVKLKLARAERERDLAQLEAEGIDLDVDEELDKVQNMSEGRYQSHLNTIKTRYRRSVVGRKTVNLAEAGRTGTKGGKAVDKKAAVQRALKKSRNEEEYIKNLAIELGEDQE